MVFAAEQDYQRYISDLRELKDFLGVKVYAYCLMTNHVHLLLAPGEAIAGLVQLINHGHLLVQPESADSARLMMKGLGQRYVQYKGKAREKGTDLFFGDEVAS